MLIWLRLIARNPDQFISYFIALQISEQLQHVNATFFCQTNDKYGF
jgi:hypothetical protein